MNLITLGQKLTPKRIAIGLILAQMTFRPLITSTNKKLPEETRRYTAAREFFTSVFSLIGTFTLVTAAERIIPALYAKKLKIPFNKETFEQIQKLPINDLLKKSTELAKLKSAFTITSFAASAVSMSIVTPILNNIFLNSFLEKIMKRNKPTNSSIKSPSNNIVNSWENVVKSNPNKSVNFKHISPNCQYTGFGKQYSLTTLKF